MPRCETCGNDYDKAMRITLGGASHFFDSFECAVQKLAPACAHCGCRILGHGHEAGGKMLLRALRAAYGREPDEGPCLEG